MTVKHTLEVDKLVERIKQDSGLTDPDQIAILTRVSVRSIDLAARAALGENVQTELDILHATALNLAEKAKNAVGQNVQAFLTQLITNALTRVLVG